MAAATFNDPHTLATFPIAQKSSSLSSHVFVAGPSKASSDNTATVLVQADGIHVIDLTSLRPEASASLGPSNVFLAPPTSRLENRDGEENKRTTYTALSVNANDAPEYWLRTWSNTGPLTPLEELKSVKLAQPTTRIFAPQWQDDRTLLLGEEGLCQLLDSDLEIIFSDSILDAGTKIVETFLFQATSCTFISSAYRQGAHSILVVFSQRYPGKLSLSIYLVKNEVTQINDLEIEVKEETTAISCNEAGFLSVTGRAGQWSAYQLHATSEGALIKQLNQSITISRLSTTHTKLLALEASLVLLASLSKDQSIVLHIWDLQYSVILAERLIPLPSYLNTLSNDKLQITLSPSFSTSTQALLSISPRIHAKDAKKKDSNGTKSLILCLPFFAPTSSSLKNAMGKAEATRKWLLQEEELEQPAKDEGPYSMVRAVGRAIQERNVASAEDAYFSWLEEATKAFEEPPVDAEEVKEATDDEASQENQKQPRERKKPKKSVAFDHALVCDLLKATIPSDPSSASVVYSSKIVHDLLGKKVVRDGMLPGGVTSALRQLKDWTGVQLALRNLPDVPEIELVTLLQMSLRTKGPNNEAAMEVDSTQAALSLPQTLLLVVRYPVSGPPLRWALQQTITSAEDMVAILNQLLNWLASWETILKQVKLKTSVAKDSRGTANIPSLEQITVFFNHLIDASFIQLLQYRPAYKVLEKIVSKIGPQVEFMEDMDRLRGLLEPFVKEEKRSLKASQVTLSAQEKRAKRREMFHAAELAVGIYQIEELTL